MNRNVIRLTMGTSLLAAMVGSGAGQASASGLTVEDPCGCKPVVDQPVGRAASTPAASNPTGSVGAAPLVNTSAIVTFAP